MKTVNPHRTRSIDTTVGRVSTRRAGSRGIDVKDAATESHPTTTIEFVGATVEDLDDGLARVTITGAGGTPGTGGGSTGSAPVTMLNNSGQDLLPGDVVVVDDAADTAVTVTIDAASTLIAGVVQAPIADGFTGPVLFNGYAPQVNTAVDVTRGEYAQTSTTAAKAGATAARVAGSFAVYLTGNDLADFATDSVVTELDTQATSLAIDLPAVLPASRFLLLALWLEDAATSVTIPGWTRIGAEEDFWYFYRISTGDTSDVATASWTNLSVATAAVLLANATVSLGVPIETHDYDSSASAAAVSGMSAVPRYAIAGVRAAASVGSGFTELAGGIGTGLAMLYNGQTGTDIVKIGLARSNDNGLTWTRSASNPVVTIGAGGTWDDEQVHAPSVVWDGSQWVMYAGGYDGANYRIGRWTSPDLTTWTPYGSNPVINLGTAGDFDDAGLLAPRVYFDNAVTPKWKMWYAGVKSGGKVTTGYASSSDGLSWTKAGRVVNVGGAGTFDDEAAVFQAPILVGSTWYLFGAGQANATSPYNNRAGYTTVALGSEGTSAAYSAPVVLSAFSGNITSLDDGLTYTSNALLCVLLQDDGTYVGYGTAFGPSPDTGRREVTWRSTSTNLTTWTAPTGVLLPLSGGTFDTFSAENPSVVSVPIAGTLAGKYIATDAAVTSPFSGVGNEDDAIFAINLMQPAKPSALLYGPDLLDTDSLAAEVGTMVPYNIPNGTTYTVPLNKQALWNHSIIVDGALVVDGIMPYVE